MKIHSLFSSLPVVILILGESLYVHSFNCQHPKTDGYTQALCATEPKQLARRDTGSSSSGGSSGTHLDDVKVVKPKKVNGDNRCTAPEQNSCCKPDVKPGTTFIHAKGLDLVCDYV
ncbi:hypothetical protein MJO28_014922 [Puccinia striiformis f. sp. tritici]|uniref:Hydrophobin n=3 Tax=Puccinia striiformis TaxID=27350 RepID=A0A0L0VF37_9BASI|nr:hypothetical protein Pst134EA_027783 [Puccinia striiformis f. sp. tritici]KAI9608111.1 hypothetical protein H4Q26_005567 [Puccinia striiformis f. sp. tritici PST-130]KNE97599.1 hypothetical protein PSTG_09148 [Puccinia striiformis f. sp. tritici PST-78]POV99627.1 hypothetical protein PSHT_13453 [Puccinia striiformis]KAH9442078.1 hypothetical protein Pst134EB_028347 [Puccinia striiformis f. sp. tritici]KAH9448473.1 hypothetical protein Pst134EA_027783 [Puccinia striiformis f. sp. tritici]